MPNVNVMKFTPTYLFISCQRQGVPITTLTNCPHRIADTSMDFYQFFILYQFAFVPNPSMFCVSTDHTLFLVRQITRERLLFFNFFRTEEHLYVLLAISIVPQRDCRYCWDSSIPLVLISSNLWLTICNHFSRIVQNSYNKQCIAWPFTYFSEHGTMLAFSQKANSAPRYCRDALFVRYQTRYDVKI